MADPGGGQGAERGAGDTRPGTADGRLRAALRRHGRADRRPGTDGRAQAFADAAVGVPDHRRAGLRRGRTGTGRLPRRPRHARCPGPGCPGPDGSARGAPRRGRGRRSGRRSGRRRSRRRGQRGQRREPAAPRSGAGGHYRDRLPVPRRRRHPGALLAAPGRRPRRRDRGTGWTVESGGLLRPGRRGPGQDDHPVGRLCRGGRPVRSALLRHLPARGRPHGPAAAAAGRGRLGGARRRRRRARAPRRIADGCLHRHRDGRLRAPAVPGPCTGSMPIPA